MYLLFDIGATNMRIAISSDGEHFDAPKVLPTPPDFEEGISVIKNTAYEFGGGAKVTACAGGIAGMFDKEKSILVRSPHLRDWEGKPLREKLQKIFEAPAYLENDAAIVGLGEAIHGAGAGYHIVAYLTISTGVGGTRIINGTIDKNASGFEPGHHIIDITGKRSFENLVSGSAFEKEYDKKPSEVTDEKIWDERARRLAYGLLNTMLYWSPDVIVLGGSMILKEPGISIVRIEQYTREIATEFPVLPVIEKARLGDFGGIYGALEFLRQNLRK